VVQRAQSVRPRRGSYEPERDGKEKEDYEGKFPRRKTPRGETRVKRGRVAEEKIAESHRMRERK